MNSSPAAPSILQMKSGMILDDQTTTFGAPAGMSSSTPRAVRGVGGSNVGERSKLSYVTCHMCETPYVEGKLFWIMSLCKHVLCSDEKHGHQAGVCTYCKTKGVEAYPLKSMSENLQAYFNPDSFSRIIEDAAEKSKYEVETLKRYISHLETEIHRKRNDIAEIGQHIRGFEKVEKRAGELERQVQLLQQ
ncbi:hypothetical protein BD324DRAFT_384830 [Kockovaella imperatae]|uniref:Uncharacterized protein n=1 Tax=Kockovaella imperatae TaxID=4999 RepID=A0A1Y1UHT8_9TREE|nr:hypothetical protein BD324DRAFT_384830 [Kockovaella imperatae]ORX37559.1 hypothetical protein BD324DRAFT_384830 [Kockovaella imperatae]